MIRIAFSKFFSALGFLIVFNTGLFAQPTAPDNFCGYTGMSPWLDWYHNHKHELSVDRGSDTSWLYVPLTLHLVGNDDGLGYYLFDQALESVCAMNRLFEQARIRYYLLPGDEVRYHNNSAWNEHNWSTGSQMINATRIPGRLNCYVVADPAGVCGYSWQDVIVMKSSCSGPENSTWAHEAGHHLSLPHPFVGWEGQEWNFNKPAPNTVGGRQVERVDGSNCKNAADRFCDTEPDYLSNRWSCNANGESLTLQHDPDSVSFRSNGRLIMGYASDACHAIFSPEQIAAMRANLRTEHSAYLQTDQPGLQIPDGAFVQLVYPIDTVEVQFDQIALSWLPVTNAQYYTVELSIFPNFIINTFKRTTTATSIQVDAFIPSNRTVYWRVKAYNNWSMCPGSKSDWQTGIFRTRNLSTTNELERHAYIQLSPNPATITNQARLLVSSDESMEALLAIHDAAGRLCHQQRLRILNGDTQIDIPTNQLKPGTYVLSLHNELGRIVRRFVIAE